MRHLFDLMTVTVGKHKHSSVVSLRDIGLRRAGRSTTRNAINETDNRNENTAANRRCIRAGGLDKYVQGSQTNYRITAN